MWNDRQIVGFGTNPDGFTEAWIATVPEPSSWVLGAIGFAGLLAAAHRCRRSARTGCHGA